MISKKLRAAALPFVYIASREIMRYIVAFISVVVLASSTASSAWCQETVPAGITYLSASNEQNRSTNEKLQASLRASPPSLRAYLSDKTPLTLQNATLVGHFLTERLRRKGELDPKGITDLSVKVQLGEGITTEQHGLILQNDQARAVFDAAFGKAIKFDKFKLRKLTANEMQMIWSWINWDLSEPIFVAEDGDDTLIFDFHEDGTLQWIEDISEPCVRFKGTDKEGKTLLSECFCLDGKAHSCGGS
jgi:hypothetical protein